MNLLNGYWLSKNRQNEYWTNIPDNKCKKMPDELKAKAEFVLKCFRSSKISYQLKDRALTDLVNTMKAITGTTFQGEKIEPVSTELLETLTKAMNKIIDFFKEFEFQPNFRFINTFSFALQNSTSAAKEYIKNYFKLIDSPYANAVSDKLESMEFKDIMDSIKLRKPSKTINSRFEIFYGSQGTGKTTKAIELAEGNCMVCHSAMLPSDLMEDFKFNDGKATFIPSALQRAIVEGKKIVLDEINLLPFESLRFLQSIVDGKSQFEYKGSTIKIAEGFKIYGTMNLSVNGIVYALPAPLVDRACNLQEFELTGTQLLNAII